MARRALAARSKLGTPMEQSAPREEGDAPDDEPVAVAEVVVSDAANAAAAAAAASTASTAAPVSTAREPHADGGDPEGPDNAYSVARALLRDLEDTCLDENGLSGFQHNRAMKLLMHIAETREYNESVWYPQLAAMDDEAIERYPDKHEIRAIKMALEQNRPIAGFFSDKERMLASMLNRTVDDVRNHINYLRDGESQQCDFFLFIKYIIS